MLKIKKKVTVFKMWCIVEDVWATKNSQDENFNYSSCTFFPNRFHVVVP